MPAFTVCAAMLVVCLVYTNVTIMAPKCLRVQREARPCTFYRKGKYCDRNFRWFCLCFADWRAEAVHHFRQTQRAEAGSEALWWFDLFLPSHLVRHSCLLIWKMNKDLLIVLLLCLITFQNKINPHVHMIFWVIPLTLFHSQLGQRSHSACANFDTEGDG